MSKPNAKKTTKASKKSSKPANAPQGKSAFPKFRNPKVEFTLEGRIHGTGHRLTADEKAEMLKLRAKDPETFTLRRLAAIFGQDPGTVYYTLNGGREKAKALAAKRAAAKKSAKAKAKASKVAKAVKASPKAA
jgi:hypothetical protein